MAREYRYEALPHQLPLACACSQFSCPGTHARWWFGRCEGGMTPAVLGGLSLDWPMGWVFLPTFLPALIHSKLTGV